jgi:hypothetical protein
MKKEKIITRTTGILFLSLGIIAILNEIYRKNPGIILWSCYISLIIIGIGFLKKDKTIVESQINFLAFPLLFWTFDFLQYLFTGKSFLGISDYFFRQGEIISKIITTQHLWSLPLSIFSIRYLKSKKNSKISIVYSIIFAILIFLGSRIFASRESNINIVYSIFGITGIQYVFLWFGGVFLIIFTTYFVLKKLKIY